VPIEIGEMDGRNAGSAVIGFVNGMYRIIFSFSTHFGQKRKTEGKSKSLSLIRTTPRNEHTRRHFWNDTTKRNT